MERAGDADPGVVPAIIALASFLENLVPPVPGDLVVTLGAAIAFAHGGPVGCYLAALAGSTLGAVTSFAFGRWLAHHTEASSTPWVRRLRQRALGATEALERHGLAILVVSRFVPGLRGAAVLAAGLRRLSATRALPAVTAGAALWNAALFALAAAVGHNLGALARWLDVYAHLTLGALAAGLLAWIGWRALHR